ncbi:unnamed protein product (macronuclear) [Paramecium tetraurelia]|uniref:Dolichyl-diphosphooligosaccharide--protein glycosyltransferase 48 kDa subunit n=1 Tax=Paramecium tetraurelia TaxID=5888 RepID=A0BIA9_PARTE|nr:uncharacterized protein GSPATT00004648001 [Paramecium tetraurelia]CAK58276.1 unnamed protein product [Paramecium tetraurelia]|eukprot:XP_001425674.1 hypothetical protein (macronuclear) [Paramecium tetraurelia strain d4-2]
MIKFLILILGLVFAGTPNNQKKVLVLSDNPAIYVSHSQFFNLLNKSFRVDYKNIQSNTFNLQLFGEWQYDHLVLFSTTNDLKVSTQELLDFYDSGRNILLLGSTDQSKYFRKFLNSFGLDMHEYGSSVVDYFNNIKGNQNIVTTSNVNILKVDKPVAHQGAGLAMTPYETFQVYGLVRGSETAFSGPNLSHNIIYVGATQGRNNARFVATGSWEILSDEFLNNSNLGNFELAQEIILWGFGQSKILKAENLIHRRLDSDDIKPYNYRLREDCYFSIDIFEWDHQKDKWVPYVSTDNDVILEFVMLDPYYRLPLKKGDGAKYELQFKIPDVYGVFQFKINYLKPGYTFLKIAEKITVRPFRHDEYGRYLVQAFPYYFSSFGTMAGFVVFLIAFLLNK